MEEKINMIDVRGEHWSHYCKMPITSEDLFAGPAINYCREYDDGKLFAGNSEYESQVNFCPICGYKTKIVIAPGEPHPMA